MASGAAFPLSVTSAFNLAIEKASAECPQVDALLAYLAHCAPGLIPMTLVDGAIGDETQLRKGIDTLDAASLLKFGRLEDGTSGVELHRLVRLVAQERSKQRGTKNDAVLRLAARLEEISPRDRDRVEESARGVAHDLDTLGLADKAFALRDRYGFSRPKAAKVL